MNLFELSTDIGEFVTLVDVPEHASSLEVINIFDEILDLADGDIVRMIYEGDGETEVVVNGHHMWTLRQVA